MMEQLQVNSKRVTFEPGNATRYDFLISKLNEEEWVAVDLINGKTVKFSDVTILRAKNLETLLVSKGYSSGDAKPMALHFMKAIHESAYIQYQPCDGGWVTRWFPDNQDAWIEEIQDIVDYGGTIQKRGAIWE